MGQGALSKPVVQWWLSLNSSKHLQHAHSGTVAEATTRRGPLRAARSRAVEPRARSASHPRGRASPVLVPAQRAERVSAQQLADSCCRIHVIATSSAMGEETRSCTRVGKHATLRWFSPPHFSRDAWRAAVISSSSSLSPVGVLVSRRLFGRRSVRSEGAGGRGRRGTRARRAPWVVLAAAVEQGRSRTPRWSLLLLLFARPVACRRPRLASSRRPPLHAERGRGGRRGTRVSRRGWFSPPQSSRAVRTRRGGLFFSCSSPVPSVAPRARRSFAPPAGRRGARATRAGARTRAERDATGAACGESERGAPSELAARGFAPDGASTAEGHRPQ